MPCVLDAGSHRKRQAVYADAGATDACGDHRMVDPAAGWDLSPTTMERCCASLRRDRPASPICHRPKVAVRQDCKAHRPSRIDSTSRVGRSPNQGQPACPGKVALLSGRMWPNRQPNGSTPLHPSCLIQTEGGRARPWPATTNATSLKVTTPAAPSPSRVRSCQRRTWNGSGGQDVVGRSACRGLRLGAGRAAGARERQAKRGTLDIDGTGLGGTGLMPVRATRRS